MKINTLNYFFVDALKSLKRNKTISIAATITVLITFFVLGTFTLLAMNFTKAVNSVADGIEIKVYLTDDATVVEQTDIENTLSSQEGVSSVTYESKDEAFLELQESLDENSGILSGYSLDNNPLQNSYVVKLTDAQYAEGAETAVESMAGVDSVTNQQDLINKITSFVKYVRIIGIALFIILVAVSIFLIMNTIKLTVYSRRREVGIMKFVGATDWFIRWPFIIEGMIIGAVGTLISSGVLYAMYRGVYNAIVQGLMVSLVRPEYILSTLIWAFVAGGIAVGAVGSIAALRKFLVV